MRRAHLIGVLLAVALASALAVGALSEPLAPPPGHRAADPWFARVAPWRAGAQAVGAAALAAALLLIFARPSGEGTGFAPEGRALYLVIAPATGHRPAAAWVVCEAAAEIAAAHGASWEAPAVYRIGPAAPAAPAGRVGRMEPAPGPELLAALEPLREEA